MSSSCAKRRRLESRDSSADVYRQRRRVQAAKKGLRYFKATRGVENQFTRTVIRVQPTSLTGRRAIGAGELIRRKIETAASYPVQPFTFTSIQGLTPAGLVLRGLCLGEMDAGFGNISRFLRTVGARTLRPGRVRNVRRNLNQGLFQETHRGVGRNISDFSLEVRNGIKAARAPAFDVTAPRSTGVVITS